MKKIFVVLAVAALCASCAKTDKCKCTIDLKLGNTSINAKQQTVYKPEDKKCSELKVEDVKGDLVSVDFSKIANIKCVPFNE